MSEYNPQQPTDGPRLRRFRLPKLKTSSTPDSSTSADVQPSERNQITAGSSPSQYVDPSARRRINIKNLLSEDRQRAKKAIIVLAGVGVVSIRGDEGVHHGLLENDSHQECSGSNETMVWIGQNATSREITLEVQKQGHKISTPEIRADNPSYFDVNGYVVPAVYDHAMSAKHGSINVCVNYQ